MTTGESPEPELAPAPGVQPDGPLPPGTAPMSETAADIQDLDVDTPRVAILMGSESDMPAMEKAEQELTKREILSETRVMSAHRQPDIVADYAKNAKLRGIRVIIAGDRRAADQPYLGGRRAGCAAVDRPDAAGRSGGLRGRRQRAQCRRAGSAHP
jgi:hypothetical protein